MEHRDQVLNCIVKKFQEGISFSYLNKLGLAPFVDESGIIRVGGRVKHSFLHFDGKRPILIPQNCPLSRLLISHYHFYKYHQGRSITMAAIRTAGFYILRCRTLVDRFIRNCIICRRLRCHPRVPIMANLPATRLEETPPFTYIGLDLIGPFNVSEGVNTRRSKCNKKAWGVVFICLVTRAIHTELVTSIDAVDFRNSFKRFLSVRGVPHTIYSDNGTNFVAVKRQMDDQSSFETLETEAKLKGIKWVMNPPLASHFGGSWERAYKNK